MAAIALEAQGNSKPVLPTLRVAPAVEARDHHDLILADRVDDAVWEAPQHCLSHFATHRRVEERVAPDGFDTGVQGAQELDGESDIIGVEPDEPENVADVEKLLNPPTPLRNPVQVGRNDPCPCGSGLKYKKCCGAR